MAEEIELKLALAEADQRRFLRLGELRKATARQTRQLVNLYYDTADLALRRRGIALRLRRQGRVWLQTVKCIGTSAGGLSARPEWEMPYSGRFDFSSIDHEPVRRWLDRPKIRSRLLPLFETNFRRTTWSFEPASGQRLLLMLDRGWIAAAGHKQPICELEIELAAGEVDALFGLAEGLAAGVTLTPLVASKAARGYALFLGTPAQAVKAAPVALSAGMTPLAAFRAIALSCLDQLQSNHPGALFQDDPEFIHQMRVATRRLRAATHLFRDCLPADLEQDLLPPLRDLMAVLGHARDLDVLQAEITAPVSAAIPGEPRLAALTTLADARRLAARQSAREAIGAADYGRHLLYAARIIHATARYPEQDGNLAEYARRNLVRLRRRCLRRAAAARVDDPHSLHALRIAIKRLRYALEFFAPLGRKDGPRRLVRRLARAQDRLGQLNDLANAGTLLMQCAADDNPLREAVSLIGGWHAPRYKALLGGVPEMLRELHSIRLPRLG